MSEDGSIEVFVNPLQLLEIDEPWASELKRPPTAEDIFRFLCTPGVPSDIESLAKRYTEISQEKTRLFATPNDQRILEKIVWPLRHAKASYIVGNFISTVSLCGMVNEMIALFLFDISSLETLEIKSKGGIQISSKKFESLRQQKRIELLFNNRVINEEMKEDFDLVRMTRNKYLHLWSRDHDSLQQDAFSAFQSTVSLVVKAFGLGIGQGKILLRPGIFQYLESPDSIIVEGKEDS